MKNDMMALTPEAIIVWPNLFETVSFNDGEERFQAVLLFEKDSDLSPLKNAIHAAALKKFPGQSKEFYQDLRKPTRNGNEKAVNDNGSPDPQSFYYGRHFMNVKSKYQPQIVNKHNEPVTNPDDIYGGCKVRAYLSFFGYDRAGNTGVSCSLRGLIKLGDGDPIGGGKLNTAEVFSEVIEAKPVISDSWEPDDIGM